MQIWVEFITKKINIIVKLRGGILFRRLLDFFVCQTKSVKIRLQTCVGLFGFRRSIYISLLQKDT